MPQANSKQVLSDKFARTAKPHARHWDSKMSGLFLRTGKNARTWCLEHKGRFHNLGRFPDMSASDAREHARALMAPSANVEIAPTLEDALRDYLGRDRLRSSHNKRAVEGLMHNHMAKFLKRRLHTISKDDIRKRYAELSVQSVGVNRLGRPTRIGGRRAANHVMQSFRTIWNHAAKRMMDGDLKSCPTAALEMHDEEPPKTIIANLGEWGEQVARLDPIHRAVHQLLLTTGMRKTEVLSLTWDQIEDDRIHLPQTKNGRAFDVPLEPEHRAILDQCRLGDGTPYHPRWVFPSSKGEGHLKQPQKIVVDGVTVTLQAHRRTFATQGASAGLAPWQVGQVLNHTIAGVTAANYIRTNVEHYRPFMRTVLDAFKRDGVCV